MSTVPRHREPDEHDQPAGTNVDASTMLVFDRRAARAVDHAAIHDYGIPGTILMENAARGLSAAAVGMVAHARPARVLIICGNGNNGGDGYALARHLHNHSAQVTLAPLGVPPDDSDASFNFRVCQRMNLPFIEINQTEDWTRTHRPHLIVDAIFGTGLDRPVAGAAAEIIQWINSTRLPVLAVDLPSGMDCDTGVALGCCVRATRTVTFIGLKQGFLGLNAQKLLGEVIVADIGAPVELLERFGTRIEIRRPNSPEHPMSPTAGPRKHPAR